MGGFHLPFDHTVSQALGAAATVAIPVGGILSTDTLLAVIKHNVDAGEVAGVPVSDYTVGDGSITAATDDSAGFGLVVIWKR